VQEALDKNIEYQGGYVSSPFEFRKRDTSKEIHPQMRFTTKTRLEKLSERLNYLFETSKLNVVFLLLCFIQEFSHQLLSYHPS